MKRTNIALVAHDGRKDELISWATFNYGLLSKHKLFATGTTGRLIEEIEVADGTRPFAGKVTRLLSGPLGGDQQIGARIVEGKIDMIVFFSDPLTAQPHDPDVKALMRIAQVYDIPMAISRAGADFMITSSFMNKEYDHDVINFRKNIENRAETL